MRHYQDMADMIDWMVSHAKDRPSLQDMARHAGYEPTHFQKTFKSYVGVTPKQFIDFMAYNTAEEFLLNQSPTLDAAYQSGLSGQGRLHDLCVRIAGTTPGAISKRGEGLTIRYGWCPSPWGNLLIGQTELGICWLAFGMNGDTAQPEQRMRAYWPQAAFEPNSEAVTPSAKQIVSALNGAQETLPLDLHGTNMQIQIWQALLKIPAGHCLSYTGIGQTIGKPKAARAVGNAVGANPIALLIPCHRVIRASGVIDNYAWGNERKRALLGLETSISVNQERL